MGAGAGAGGTGGGARPIVPAPYVPEELVSQAQVVLQGKSRNLIIRELQVTLQDSSGMSLYSTMSKINISLWKY
jgi:E3 ubiquitin-protein ligase EDD1